MIKQLIDENVLYHSGICKPRRPIWGSGLWLPFNYFHTQFCWCQKADSGPTLQERLKHQYCYTSCEPSAIKTKPQKISKREYRTRFQRKIERETLDYVYLRRYLRIVCVWVNITTRMDRGIISTKHCLWCIFLSYSENKRTVGAIWTALQAETLQHWILLI